MQSLYRDWENLSTKAASNHAKVTEDVDRVIADLESLKDLIQRGTLLSWSYRSDYHSRALVCHPLRLGCFLTLRLTDRGFPNQREQRASADLEPVQGCDQDGPTIPQGAVCADVKMAEDDRQKVQPDRAPIAWH
jgi:hypothetical protein